MREERRENGVQCPRKLAVRETYALTRRGKDNGIDCAPMCTTVPLRRRELQPFQGSKTPAYKPRRRRVPLPPRAAVELPQARPFPRPHRAPWSGAGQARAAEPPKWHIAPFLLPAVQAPAPHSPKHTGIHTHTHAPTRTHTQTHTHSHHTHIHPRTHTHTHTRGKKNQSGGGWYSSLYLWRLESSGRRAE